MLIVADSLNISLYPLLEDVVCSDANVTFPAKWLEADDVDEPITWYDVFAGTVGA